MRLEKVTLFDDSEEIDVTHQVLAGHPLSEGKGISVRRVYDPELALLNLIDDVEADPIAYDAARIAIGHIIFSGGTFPPLARAKAAAIATGTMMRPLKKGKIAGATVPRDRLLYHLIIEVGKVMQIAPTTASRECGHSACGAVAEGLRLLGLQPNSYSQMEKIYLKGTEFRTFSTDQD